MVYLYIYRLTDGDLRLHTETGLEKLHREFIYIFLVVCVSTVAYNIYYIYIYICVERFSTYLYKVARRKGCAETDNKLRRRSLYVRAQSDRTGGECGGGATGIGRESNVKKRPRVGRG